MGGGPLGHVVLVCASRLSMKSHSLPGASSQIILPPNVHQQFWQADCTVLVWNHTTEPLFQEDTSPPPPPHTHTHTLHLMFFLVVCFLGTFPSPPSCVPLSRFFDWLDSTLISMSHYLLEYSGGMLPVAAIPIIIIPNMVHDFQVSGSASAFFFLSRFSVACEGGRLFQGHLLRAPAQERDTEKGLEGVVGWRGGGGGGGGKLEWSTLNLLNQILAPGCNCPAAVLGVAAATTRPNYWPENGDLSRHAASPGIIFYQDQKNCFPCIAGLMSILFTGLGQTLNCWDDDGAWKKKKKKSNSTALKQSGDV